MTRTLRLARNGLAVLGVLVSGPTYFLLLFTTNYGGRPTDPYPFVPYCVLGMALLGGAAAISGVLAIQSRGAPQQNPMS